MIGTHTHFINKQNFRSVFKKHVDKSQEIINTKESEKKLYEMGREYNLTITILVHIKEINWRRSNKIGL